MQDEQKKFNVVVWFKNGESRSFRATKVYYDQLGMAIDTDYGVVGFNLDSIAGHLNEDRKWPEEWNQ